MAPQSVTRPKRALGHCLTSHFDLSLLTSPSRQLKGVTECLFPTHRPAFLFRLPRCRTHSLARWSHVSLTKSNPECDLIDHCCLQFRKTGIGCAVQAEAFFVAFRTH